MNRMILSRLRWAAVVLAASGASAGAQTAPAPTAQTPAAPAVAQTAATQSAPTQSAGQPAPGGANAPDSLVLYFDFGSAAVRPSDEALLDQASRLYRDGHPIIMVLSAGTDTVGSPEANLRLSEQRAGAVLRGLIARGIPADRFQLLAKGETDPAVKTADEVPEGRNRRVEISWR
jgi:outer membrane protein OmpA-like peptidoglycan-associated protein